MALCKDCGRGRVAVYLGRMTASAMTCTTADGFALCFADTDRGWEIADATRVQHRGYVTAEVATLVKANATAFDLSEISDLVKAAKAEGRCSAVDHNRLRGRVRSIKPTDPSAPTSESYWPVRRGHGHPQIDCEALTGKLAVSGQCWGQTEWIESRSPLHGRCAVARCHGHRGPTYRAERG
jgi:hypothetical protein